VSDVRARCVSIALYPVVSARVRVAKQVESVHGCVETHLVVSAWVCVETLVVSLQDCVVRPVVVSPLFESKAECQVVEECLVS